MKRVSFNSHQSPSFDEEARLRLRHQSLLQDYLELQKDFVSKKKKFKSTNQKRSTLLAEVRFLRLREAYLLKMQASRTETEIDESKHRNFNAQPELSAKEENGYANDDALKSHTRVSNTKRILDRVDGKGEAIGEAVRIQKKPKNGLVNSKRAVKKKISVQDQVVLEA